MWDRLATMSNDTYLIEDASTQVGDPALIARWRTLLAESDSHGRVYQSPEFFDYLLSTAAQHAPPQLLTVKERRSGMVVGIVPLTLRCHSFEFAAGRLSFGSVPVPCVVLLGSAPLMPAEPALLDLLLEFLLTHFAQCQAISLTSLPSDSGLWRCIARGQRDYRTHVLNDWRDCHQIPLPASFEAFMAQFGSKRRYNLKRQQRQLSEHGGGQLTLHRIEHPGQLAAMGAALSRLSTPEHREQLWTPLEMQELARHGMLLCYQIDSGGLPCALMLGLRSSDTLHLFNLFHDSALDHFSVGTTMLHMAIEDMCDRLHFKKIDLGYGTPGHAYPSTNVTVRRAHVLLMRANMRNRLACWLHRRFSAMVAWARLRIK
jgi:CelD/BcsL family acetyltransferase involved in cellulose biosynthesis